MNPENGIIHTLYLLKFTPMENLKKLASMILEKPGIKHEELKPRKGEINELREYLSKVWFKLITTYIAERGYTFKLTKHKKSKLGSMSVKCKKIDWLNWVSEDSQKRQYQIIKIK